MSKSKGDSRERELVNHFYNAGFAVIRAPGSGGGTKRELPDVLASDGAVIYAIEAKARKIGRIYLTGQEVENLVFFARKFGAKARIGVRYDYGSWYFFHPGELHVTNGGNFRISKEHAREAGTPLESLIQYSKN